MISVQAEDFDLGAEYEALRQASPKAGAIVTFTGLVRDFCAAGDLTSMTLEHYPGMTESSLEKIIVEARERWDIDAVKIIHRVGTLAPRDQIVFVGVSSAHREHAFNACAFMMDYLKTRAPFWKKESTETGEQWVDFKDSDQHASDRWEK